MKKSYLVIFFCCHSVQSSYAVPAPDIISAEINIENQGNYNGRKTYSNGFSYDISVDIQNKEYCVFVGGQKGCSELYIIEENSSSIKFYTYPYFNSSCKHSFNGRYSSTVMEGSFSNPSCADSTNGSWFALAPTIVDMTPSDEGSIVIPTVVNDIIFPEYNTKVYVNTNSQNIYKNEVLQVYFNTLVSSNDSKKYDVYLSVKWDENVVFDNGTELVTNKVPLFKNIEVPTFTSWFEYERLRYSFPENTPQTDYIVGLHLIDSEGNAVFEDFSSVSYYPKISPFSIDGAKKIRSKAKVKKARASKKTCILGGAIQVDTKAQKYTYLALQMGSDLAINIDGSYPLVKGAFNLVKSGDKVCNHMNDFEGLLNSYDNNIGNGITDDQATSLFAIEFMLSILKDVKGAGALYSWLAVEDFMNGLKDVVKLSNKSSGYRGVLISSNNTLTIKLDQPWTWNVWWFVDSIDLEVTVTPVFTYGVPHNAVADPYGNKIPTTKDNIKGITQDWGKANSKGGEVKKTDLSLGLYMIKASIKKDGKEVEVYRDTVHLIKEKMEHTMVIDRR